MPEIIFKRPQAIFFFIFVMADVVWSDNNIESYNDWREEEQERTSIMFALLVTLHR